MSRERKSGEDRAGLYLISRDFKHNPRPYIVQSLLATVVMTAILCILDILMRPVIIAAIGASVFIVFALPQSRTAGARRLVGGHFAGIICGAVCSFLFDWRTIGKLGTSFEPVRYLGGALAVGLALFFMTITDTEHPPAAGTALGFYLNGWSWETAVFTVVFAAVLAVFRRLFLSRLRDLF